MGKVVNFQDRRLAALNYDDAIVREPTCDEIVEAMPIDADEAADRFLTMNEGEELNRIETITQHLLDSWEELLFTVHPNYISELKQRMIGIENRAYSQDPEAS